MASFCVRVAVFQAILVHLRMMIAAVSLEQPYALVAFGNRALMIITLQAAPQRPQSWKAY